MLVPSGFSLAAENCLGQYFLPKLATSNNWQWQEESHPVISDHLYPVQDTSNRLELCNAWVAIWLLFLCNPPLSASFPRMWITHHSLAPQPLSAHLLLKTLSDTYVLGSASSWLPSMEGQMIRMHPGYPETTPGLSTGKANSASQHFLYHDLQESILFEQLIEGNEGSCLGWLAQSLTHPLGWGYPYRLQPILYTCWEDPGQVTYHSALKRVAHTYTFTNWVWLCGLKT